MPMVIEIAGSSTVMSGSGRGSSRSARVSPMVISGMPAIGDDVAGAGLSAGHPLERLGHEQLGDLDALDRAVVRGTRRPAGPCASVPVVDAAQREAAEVRRGVEVGDVRLQRAPRRRTSAPGWCSRIVSNSGSRFSLSGMPPSSGRFSEARPALAEA